MVHVDINICVVATSVLDLLLTRKLTSYSQHSSDKIYMDVTKQTWDLNDDNSVMEPFLEAVLVLMKLSNSTIGLPNTYFLVKKFVN